MAVRYDPARWICQCKSTICNGVFYVYGQKQRCPLYPRCKGNRHQLEYLYPQQSVFQRKVVLSDPQRYLEHAARSRDLRRAFVPEKVKRENQACYQRSKDKYSAWSKEKYRQQHPPGFEKPRTDISPPPCGGECGENCPYDDDCHYPRWETEQVKKLAAEMKKARNKENYARKRARMKADPAYAAYIRRLKRESKARVRAKKKAAKEAEKANDPGDIIPPPCGAENP